MLTMGLVFGASSYSQKLQLRSDFLELLPRDSPGFKAFEHQLGRVGGGATLIVINESPDRKANERFVDALSDRLKGMVDDHRRCVAACASGDGSCAAACGPELMSYVESGTKDVRAYFETTKWLYASMDDLRSADETLDHQIAIRSGLVEQLDEGADNASRGASPRPAPPSSASPVEPSMGDAKKPSEGPSEVLPSETSKPETSKPETSKPETAAAEPKKPALGLDAYRERWKAKAHEHDDFPTGYFATTDGTMMGIRIVATSGLGDARGDMLLQRVKDLAAELNPAKFHPEMKVGYAGDIPNAAHEKQSLVSEGFVATLIASVLILAGLVYFYRSFWPLIIIALPALVGVSCAYAFATATYGYVNTSGVFLGAIILGNGINYPIVLLARYREFRGRGMAPDEARREAVLNAFRAELVGASVAGIAYGSLTITRFRGFSQFGVIGFVGMFLVWASIVPLVPALVVLSERTESWFKSFLESAPFRSMGQAAAVQNVAKLRRRLSVFLFSEDGAQGPVARMAAFATERAPYVFVVLGIALTIVAATRIPAYLKDPWEYDFDKLGSRSSNQAGGAGDWSYKADRVFGGKMNIAGALMLADKPEQVPQLKKQILENDASDPQGPLLAEISTVQDVMPGTFEEQAAKLEVLESIRERLTPAVLGGLSAEERARVEEIRPPDDLKVVRPEDLPPLLRRRFEENNGVVGTVFYVKPKNNVALSDGHNQLRIAKATDNVVLPDGTLVQTASRSTIFAEMLNSMRRDGPLASAASFLAVVVVVLLATSSLRGAIAVISALLMGVVWTLGGAAYFGQRLNYINFIAFPITFGIGCEYPFNIFDRSRLLGGNISEAVRRSGGAVLLCSYTTVVGYGSLLFSDFQALESFGRLAVSGEIACMFAALLFMPSLLHIFQRRAGGAVLASTEGAEG
jgi:hypothetical protein